MVFLLQELHVFIDESLNSPHFLWTQTLIAAQSDRCKPELAFPVRCCHMNVRRLSSFIGVK
jgi:hypothetical protein